MVKIQFNSTIFLNLIFLKKRQKSLKRLQVFYIISNLTFLLDDAQVPQSIAPSSSESNKEVHHPKPSKKWTKKDSELDLAPYVIINGKLSSDSVQSIIIFSNQNNKIINNNK